jgi:hypothetical protein
MKARVTFYFAAVVALVLFLACVQSHATERRDPLIIQDTPQTQAARSTSMVRATALATKPGQSSPRKTKTAAGKSHESLNPVGDAKDKPSENTGARQTGSSNSGGSK